MTTSGRSSANAKRKGLEKEDELLGDLDELLEQGLVVLRRDANGDLTAWNVDDPNLPAGPNVDPPSPSTHASGSPKVRVGRVSKKQRERGQSTGKQG